MAGVGGSNHVLIVAGTRPEAIKLAPLLLAATERPALELSLLATGQHGRPFDDALAEFGLAATWRLPAPAHDDDPDVMIARFADAIGPVLARERPRLVLVQGDTNSAYAGAFAAHRLGIPVGHVEAGLRSGDLASPWPEERNRIAIDVLAALRFAPTGHALANLAAEGLPGLITGNTGVDALAWMLAQPSVVLPAEAGERQRILLTCHRRESHGAGIERICDAALRLVARGDVHILCPVHGNPRVGDPVRARLGGHPAISLLPPLPYRELVAEMAAARLILTDSGGIQEEAPALGVPALVLRDVTERQEGIESGNLALVGTNVDHIVAAATRLLDDPAAHAAMARPAQPFGEAGAAAKILDHIVQYFSTGGRADPPLPSVAFGIMDTAPTGV